MRDGTDAVRLEAECGDDPHKVWNRLGSVTRNGTIGGLLGLYEVRYALSDDAIIRSILIETAPDTFHEICVQKMEPWAEQPAPASVVRSVVPWIVGARYDQGGNYHFRSLDFFVVTKTGAAQLDLSPLVRAAETGLPPKQILNSFITSVDFGALVYEIGTQLKNSFAGPKVSCCEGTITAHFRLQHYSSIGSGEPSVHDPDLGGHQFGIRVDRSAGAVDRKRVRGEFRFVLWR